MKELIGRILQQYGSAAEVTVRRGYTGGAGVYPAGDGGGLGERAQDDARHRRDPARAVCVHRSGGGAAGGGSLWCARAEGRYRVQRAERLFFADETLYVWGLLREDGR